MLHHLLPAGKYSRRLQLYSTLSSYAFLHLVTLQYRDPKDKMLDQHWREIVDKWDCGIDVSTASDKDLNKYTESRILAYEDEEICDKDLWEVFKTEFKNFTTITISRISS